MYIYIYTDLQEALFFFLLNLHVRGIGQICFAWVFRFSSKTWQHNMFYNKMVVASSPTPCFWPSPTACGAARHLLVSWAVRSPWGNRQGSKWRLGGWNFPPFFEILRISEVQWWFFEKKWAGSCVCFGFSLGVNFPMIWSHGVAEEPSAGHGIWDAVKISVDCWESAPNHVKR